MCLKWLILFLHKLYHLWDTLHQRWALTVWEACGQPWMPLSNPQVLLGFTAFGLAQTCLDYGWFYLHRQAATIAGRAFSRLDLQPEKISIKKDWWFFFCQQFDKKVLESQYTGMIPEWCTPVMRWSSHTPSQRFRSCWCYVLWGLSAEKVCPLKATGATKSMAVEV